MEHAAHNFPEFQSNKIVSLVVSPSITCVQLDSGGLYWWSVSCLNFYVIVCIEIVLFISLGIGRV